MGAPDVQPLALAAVFFCQFRLLLLLLLNLQSFSSLQRLMLLVPRMCRRTAGTAAYMKQPPIQERVVKWILLVESELLFRSVIVAAETPVQKEPLSRQHA